MTYYSTLVKDQINRDIRVLDGFYDGYVYKDAIIKQGTKSIGINYAIDSATGVTYAIRIFNKDNDSVETIDIEEIDNLFTLTVKEYISHLKDILCSYESGIDEDGHLYIEVGDNGWMGYVDGQYVISSYGNMKPCDILNELCSEEVTNNSKAHKCIDRETDEWVVRPY